MPLPRDDGCTYRSSIHKPVLAVMGIKLPEVNETDGGIALERQEAARLSRIGGDPRPDPFDLLIGQCQPADVRVLAELRAR